MDYSQIASLPNLTPGTTSPDVKKLQNWLIKSGFNIADGATGFYGPQTKAAVAQWQQRSGIDTQGNPGYFGPISKQYAQKQLGQGSSNTNTGGNVSDQAQMDSLRFLGFTDQQIASMSSGDKKNFALTGEYLKKQTDLGNVTAQNNAASLQKAYQSAVNDPNIKAKYGDIDQSAQANFANTIGAFQEGSDINTANQKIQFKQQQQNLAEQSAAAGQAYSGFRNQAKSNLDTQQSGIVRSSISQLKQGLRDSLAPLEQYYGTKKFKSMFGNQQLNYDNPLTGNNENIGYDRIGNLTGTLAAQKQGDIANRQGQIYQNTSSPY